LVETLSFPAEHVASEAIFASFRGSQAILVRCISARQFLDSSQLPPLSQIVFCAKTGFICDSGLA
jgi:hypothetical protein